MTGPLRDNLTVDRMRALLVAAITPSTHPDDLAELARLADTAGADVVATVTQKRRRPDPATYVGRGKVTEVHQLVREHDVDVVVCDDDLTTKQAKALEARLKCTVIDRSELILDIFSTRARTRQSRLQVELAQLEYALSHLRRLWTHLERQAGGTSTRGGPGEKQIEIDRRLARRRIKEVRRKLESVGRQAETARSGRRGLFRVSLVGYTNAGKSTLMRALVGGDVLVQDKLFSTLDTLTRRLDDHWPPILLSDTVGFIRKLPKHLLGAFRSTLAEACESDLLLDVVDASDAAVLDRLQVVDRVLEAIGAGGLPRWTVCNKVDRCSEEQLEQLKDLFGDRGIYLSARDGTGLDDLRERLHEAARREACPVEISVGAGDGEWVSRLLKMAEPGDSRWESDRLHVKLVLPEEEIARYMSVSGLKIEKLDASTFDPGSSSSYTSGIGTSLPQTG